MAKKLGIGILLVSQAAGATQTIDVSVTRESQATTADAVRADTTAVFNDVGNKTQIIDLSVCPGGS